jgi:hypothetical protein
LISPKPGFLSTCTPQGDQKEKWQALCEQAANEQDPEKLMALVAQIDHLLAEKQQRLGKQESGLDTDASSHIQLKVSPVVDQTILMVVRRSSSLPQVP